jgi:hypothetical protein
MIEEQQQQQLPIATLAKRPLHKVDKDCELKNMNVVDDYTCHLQLDDISYNEDQ